MGSLVSWMTRKPKDWSTSASSSSSSSSLTSSPPPPSHKPSPVSSPSETPNNARTRFASHHGRNTYEGLVTPMPMHDSNHVSSPDPPPLDTPLPASSLSRNGVVDSYFDPVPTSSCSASSSMYPGSPPPQLEGQMDMRINEPFPSREVDMQDISEQSQASAAADQCLDDEGLSVLEKIYLFSVSSASFHR